MAFKTIELEERMSAKILEAVQDKESEIQRVRGELEEQNQRLVEGKKVLEEQVRRKDRVTKIEFRERGLKMVIRHYKVVVQYLLFNKGYYV